MRKFAIALFSACLVTIPMSAHGLGFGNIRINSALNEPLNAEIDLLSATKSDLKGLNIKLASTEAFMRAGIERPGHLNQIRFTIKTRSNGRPYLKLTTKQSIREPFLDFLLEMNWKNGRMLREYTVLLDPPGQMRQEPAVVQTPASKSEDVVSEQEAQAEASSSPFIEAEPVVEVEPEPGRDVVEAEPVQEIAEVSEQSDEPVAEESIAASTEESETEAEPVPLSDTIPENEVTPIEEPAGEEEQASIASSEKEVSEEAAPETEKVESELAGSAEAEAEPFAGEEVSQRVPVEEETVAEESAIQEESAVAEEQIEREPAVDASEGITTKRNDNLWTIAESMRDGNTTIYQVMMALLQSNPDAFIEGNVHRLKVGQVLRIEDPSLLSSISKRQAAQEYIAQTGVWEEYRAQLAGRDTPTQPVMAGDTAETGEVLPEQIPEQQSSGELVLAAPEGDSQTAGTTADKDPGASNEVVILREEIRQALKEAEIEGNKNIELNTRLRELEGQLNELQRSLSVKDDELASLQQQLSVVNQQNVEQEKQAAEAEERARAEAIASQEQGSAVMSEEQAVQSEENAAQQQATEQQSTGAQTEQDSLMTNVTETASGMLDKGTGFIGGILSAIAISPLVLAAGGGVVIALLLALLFIIKRRQKTANFQESILSGIPADDAMISEEVSLETNLSGESSFLSDFAISGASALSSQDSEVDPLTEADVFMAYGRYEAAEERIVEAIKKDPTRSELRVKLLELYNTTKNTPSFEAAAQDFFSQINSDVNNPQWQKVMAMGSVLAPENPLFNESDVTDMDFSTDPTVFKGVDPTVIRGKPQAESDIMDIGLDTGAFTTDDFSSAESGLDMPDMDLDLNLEGGSDLQTDDLDLSFDLSEEETAQVDADIAGEDTAQVDLGEALDFDMGGELTENVEELSLDSEAADEVNLDFSLEEQLEPSMVLNMDDNTMEALDAGSIEMTMELDQPNDGETQAMTMDNISLADMTAGELDATDAMELDIPSDMDEVGTKLDLAKAYIDMGDPDGAKSILDEVMTEGTPPQQQEAQQLMQQI
ncbi:MAG: hypothetical protein OEZ33_01745 [Gammaproteobacteria bacterium]|nr:hypothetical protein [Gammaproteobacteria bacterium]